MNSDKPIPSPLVAFIPVIVLVLMLYMTIGAFGSDALSGGSQISLLVATAVCVSIGQLFYRVKWHDFEVAIGDSFKGIGASIMILLVIGALSAAWMISGIVPTLIYYGIKIINPQFFLATTCIICAIVSVVTGSSWTTIATIGIALIGIGKAQGFPDGIVAGAIISGAYFGDKMSPLSDTTVLAASVNQVPLFTHIRNMFTTTVPAISITLVIFAIMGFFHEAVPVTDIDSFTSAITARFNITPWVLLVPVLTGILIARKVPSLITLFASTAMAVGAACIFQMDLVHEVAQTQSVFKGIMQILYGSTSLPTQSELLTELISTNGMSGMLDTVWLILCAISFGAAMTASRMLTSIGSLFVRAIKGRFSLVASTVGTGFFFNVVTADQYISILLTGNIFSNIYRKCGYDARLLSRTTEDAVTVTSPIVPWTTCGMTQATILGVPTLVYAPYCFFCFLCPLVAMVVAAIGYGFDKLRIKKEEE